MKQTYAWPLRGLLARVAVLLTSWRPLAGCGAALLLLLLLATPAARAQAPTVTVTPAGPLTLCPGSTQTLTATATVPGFNVAGTGFNGDVLAVAVQADGKVLVGGYFTAYNGDANAPDCLLRLNADGSLDNAFNAGGAGANGFVNALAVQADGKVLVGGFFTSYNGNAAAPDYVLRLNAGGSLDAGFNAGGAGADNTVFAVAVQADGKVLVGGVFTSYNGNAAALDYLLRLNVDGSLNDGTLAGLAYTWSNGATGPSITVSQPGDYQAKATTSNGTGYSNVVRVNAPLP
jgi:uncharacterized delta-60 repeat protein